VSGAGVRRQIDGGVLAATIDFEFEFETIAFVEARHAGAFDRRDVDECIGLPVIALNETKAFHRVEELDRSARLFTGQRALRRARAAAEAAASTTARGTRARIAITWGATIGDRHRLTIDLEIGRRDTPAAIDEGEAERLTFGQTGEPGLFDRRDVNEHVFAAIIANDEAEAFLPVEEFHDAGAFADDLRGHAAASAATAAKAAAAATSAAAAAESAAAATTAEAITAATEPVSTAAETIAAATATKAAAVTAAEAAAAFIAAETVALVTSASAAIAAATFVKTHA